MCLTCKGINDIVDKYDTKITELLEDEDTLNATVVESMIKCDNVKVEYKTMVGMVAR